MIEFETYQKYFVEGLYRDDDGSEFTFQDSCWARSHDEAVSTGAPSIPSELVKLIKCEAIEGVTTQLPKR